MVLTHFLDPHVLHLLSQKSLEAIEAGQVLKKVYMLDVNFQNKTFLFIQNFDFCLVRSFNT